MAILFFSFIYNHIISLARSLFIYFLLSKMFCGYIDLQKKRWFLLDKHLKSIQFWFQSLQLSHASFYYYSNSLLFHTCYTKSNTPRSVIQKDKQLAKKMILTMIEAVRYRLINVFRTKAVILRVRRHSSTSGRKSYW